MRSLALAILLSFVAWPAVLHAQLPAAESSADSPPALRGISQRPHNRVAVATDLFLKEGECCRDAVVVFGDANIEGTVQGRLLVICGRAKFGANGLVRGDLTVLAGSVEFERTGQVLGHQQLFGARRNATPGSWTRWPQDWFNKGLLWGRPFPPQSVWTWVLAAFVLGCYVLLAFVFPKPVEAALEAFQTKPGTSILVGLLVLVCLGPLLVLLAALVVGLVLIPFIVCAAALAFLVGKVVIYRYAGEQLGAQTGLTVLRRPIPALVAGSLLFFLVYTIPILGLVVWGALAPMGLGAVFLALFKRLRAEGAPAASVPEALEMATAPPYDLSLQPRVGFWKRTLATLIDFVLIAILAGGLTRLTGLKWFVPLWVAYHLWLWTAKGATVGGLVLGLRIIQPDGRPLTFTVALIRGLASFLSAAALLLGFFWAGWSTSKRAWHDTIAGTLVVQAPRDYSHNPEQTPGPPRVEPAH